MNTVNPGHSQGINSWDHHKWQNPQILADRGWLSSSSKTAKFPSKFNNVMIIVMAQQESKQARDRFSWLDQVKLWVMNLQITRSNELKYVRRHSRYLTYCGCQYYFISLVFKYHMQNDGTKQWPMLQFPILCVFLYICFYCQQHALLV